MTNLKPIERIHYYDIRFRFRLSVSLLINTNCSTINYLRSKIRTYGLRVYVVLIGVAVDLIYHFHGLV